MTKIPAFPIFELIESNADATTDGRIIIDGKSIPIHKSYLSLISPVFLAMFTHDTIEAKTGEVNITDFTFEDAKTAIDYCYGKDLCDKTSFQLLGVLRFADKYGILPIRKRLAEYFERTLNHDNCHGITAYSYEFSEKNLQTKCIDYYYRYPELILTPDFTQLPQNVMMEVITEASKLNDDELPAPYLFRHARVSCDSCGMKPIMGTRFKCMFCCNYNLCQSCERRGVHGCHVMLRIVNHETQGGTLADAFSPSMMKQWQ
uniref:BTB domain-containing protein n=1 Tax=Panagrellus redivivus TaxID=6233 RepID=A0A7E4VGQ0_PANRE